MITKIHCQKAASTSTNKAEPEQDNFSYSPGSYHCLDFIDGKYYKGHHIYACIVNTQDFMLVIKSQRVLFDCFTVGTPDCPEKGHLQN